MKDIFKDQEDIYWHTHTKKLQLNSFVQILFYSKKKILTFFNEMFWN